MGTVKKQYKYDLTIAGNGMSQESHYFMKEKHVSTPRIRNIGLCVGALDAPISQCEGVALIL